MIEISRKIVGMSQMLVENGPSWFIRFYMDGLDVGGMMVKWKS